MADLDLGTAAALPGASASASALTVAGGLCGAMSSGPLVSGRLGGLAALVASGGGSSAPSAVLAGDLVPVPIVGASSVSSVAVAARLDCVRGLAAWSYGAAEVSGLIWSFPCGRSAGSCRVFEPHLLCARPLGEASASVSASASASLSWDVRLVGGAGAASAVASSGLVVSLPLRGHSGQPGWERPQVAGASAGGAAASAAGLVISGIPNVELVA